MLWEILSPIGQLIYTFKMKLIGQSEKGLSKDSSNIVHFRPSLTKSQMVYAEFQAKKHVDVSGPEGMKKATNRDIVNA